MHFPPESVAPHWDVNEQNSPAAHSPGTPRVPHVLPSAMAEPLSPAHAPFAATDTLLRPATQAVAYVFPSQPQTGANSMVHMSGIGLHSPAMSPAPQCALTGNEQYCLSAQRKPAMPPHILPSGDRRPPPGAAAGGVAEAAGAELTTPFGVSTGMALDVAAGALAVATGACGPGAGADCEEHALTEAKDRNATEPSNHHLCMRQALAIQARAVEAS